MTGLRARVQAALTVPAPASAAPGRRARKLTSAHAERRWLCAQRWLSLQRHQPQTPRAAFQRASVPATDLAAELDAALGRRGPARDPIGQQFDAPDPPHTRESHWWTVSRRAAG